MYFLNDDFGSWVDKNLLGKDGDDGEDETCAEYEYQRRVWAKKADGTDGWVCSAGWEDTGNTWKENDPTWNAKEGEQQCKKCKV
jgi:hypothetical protein